MRTSENTFTRESVKSALPRPVTAVLAVSQDTSEGYLGGLCVHKSVVS
jgi:hypothetical protein